MTPAQRQAEEIVGQVDWQSDAHGLCRCPGEATHTSHTRVRDTTVFVDSVPTIFCWHTSCTAYRDEANRKLRKAILNDPLYRPVNIMSRWHGECATTQANGGERHTQAHYHNR
jgi:hypothetical protein